MDSVERSVAQNDNDITGFELRTEPFDNFCRRRLMEGLLASFFQVGHKEGDIEALLGMEVGGPVDFSDDNSMSGGECRREVVLEKGAAGGVGARFKERPEP